MQKKRFRDIASRIFSKKPVRWLLGIALVVIAVVLLVQVGSDDDNFKQKYEGQDLSADIEGVTRNEITYSKYLSLPQYKNAQDAQLSEPIVLELDQYEIVPSAGTRDKKEDEIARVYTEDGYTVLYTGDGSFLQWKVTVPESGWYNVQIDYRALRAEEGGRSVDIERALYIDYGTPVVDENGNPVQDENGETELNRDPPFSGASMLTFSLLWHDQPFEKEEDRYDNQGNQRRAKQEELFDWQKVSCRDPMGYVVEPYRFYFEAGREHTIALRAVNEPMEIRSIKLTAPQKYDTYDQYTSKIKENYPESEKAGANDQLLVSIQGEDAVRRSSPSLFPRYDRSSPATEPYDVYHTILNYIGGDSWNNAGQWLEWELNVPDDGWYCITIKARQNHQRGAISCRSLYIDGEIPCEEVSSISFGYNTAWEMNTLSDSEGTPLQFYLPAGNHTIRLEATLGEMGSILQEMDDSIYRLNQIYRKILVLTGVSPDRFRDYNLESIYPEIIEGMDLEAKRLYKLVDDTVAVTGQKSDRIAVAQTLAVQLEGFVNHTERITQQFSNFKDNITSLGTSMLNMSETKLDIDLIMIHGADYQVPAVNDGLAASAGNEIKSLAASYSVDYDSVGNKYEGDDVLDVWITTGRDQSAILKNLIDQDFTPNFGVNVNVKLVVADTLLTAVVAGNGPDVVLSVGSWFPVNYALRHAVEDMTQFEARDYELNGKTVHVKSYEEVTAPDIYERSALAPFQYRDEALNPDHVGVYGIPETMDFNLVFYRKDVLEEMGIAPESWDDLSDWHALETWQDIIDLLPTIQGNNMTVGVPFPDVNNVDTSVLNSMIYQHGGSIYDTYNTKTLIDSEEGVSAFKLYTSLYNDYGLPIVYDFVSRFRTGEMPIGVASYGMYNNLAVSAPEIRGLWGFTYYPGTVRTAEDGSTYIDNTVHSGGTCSMIIKTDDDTVRQNAWTFIQWWADAQTQVNFGREMEAVLGSSARYTTANKKAMVQLGWSDSQQEILLGQMSKTRGFPEIAGGYSTTRHMTNAIRRVINNKEDARETLLTYTKTINEEIKIKRQEFGLSTDAAELEKLLSGTNIQSAVPPDGGSPKDSSAGSQ